MKKLIVLSLPVILISGVMSLLWLMLHNYGNFPTMEHETIGKLNDGAWLVYVLVAALVLQNAWQRIQKMQGAINKKDKEQFFSLLKSDIPPVLHFFIGLVALFIVINYLLSDYDDIYEGMYSIFQVSFILTIFYITLFEVINVFGGFWKLDCTNIEKDWTVEINEYFDTKKPLGRFTMHHFNGEKQKL